MKINREIMQKMGTQIRKAREHVHLKQSDLAARLDVDRSSIADWEAGNSMIHASHLPRLAEILNVSILFFFEHAQATNPPSDS